MGFKFMYRTSTSNTVLPRVTLWYPRGLEAPVAAAMATGAAMEGGCEALLDLCCCVSAETRADNRLCVTMKVG